jgi:hypothetical protein
MDPVMADPEAILQPAFKMCFGMAWSRVPAVVFSVSESGMRRSFLTWSFRIRGLVGVMGEGRQRGKPSVLGLEKRDQRLFLRGRPI